MLPRLFAPLALSTLLACASEQPPSHAAVEDDSTRAKQQALSSPAVWSRLVPVERTDPAAAVLNGRIVFHGGIGSGTGGRSTALLEFDGTEWHSRSTVTRPPAGTAGLARIGNRLVHVPGDVSRPFETWEWDGSQWLQRLPAHSPPVRYHYGMASFGNQVLLFGGRGADNLRRNDTWLWNGVDWTEVQTATRPPAMDYPGLAEFGGKMVLFGGNSSDLQTWEFDGVDWQKKVTPVRPPPRSSFFVLASTSKGVVLFGGLGGSYLNDTWIWDGSTWTEIKPATSPPGRFHHALATLNDEVYLLGGAAFGSAGSVWRFDGVTWTRVYEPVRYGIPYSAAAMGSKTVVLTGSLTSSETWEWDGSTWMRKQTAHTPPPRYNPAFVGLGNKVLMFGGRTNSGYLDDTWIYDGNDWTELTPVNKPSPRRNAALGAYGTGALLFGGEAAFNYFDDTWVWDGTNWNLKPKGSVSPPGREKAALGELGGKAVLFGGSSGTARGDVWEWDGSTWKQLPASPFAADHTPFAPFKGELVLSTASGELWSYSGSGWTKTPTSGDLPEHPVAAVVPMGDYLMALHTDISRIDFVVPDGAACTVDAQCSSRFCTDGVCCTSACKGDCEACSVAAGAAFDGLCTPAPATQSCRGSAGACDPEEFCDGTSGMCPSDSRRHPGFECRAAQGVCDVAETCDGTSAECPDDAVMDAGVTCRDATCSGEGTVAAASTCDGVGSSCPESEALACAANERCEDGACTPLPEEPVVDAGTIDTPDAGVEPEVPATGCGCGAGGAGLGLIAPLAFACWVAGGMRVRRRMRASGR